MFKNKRCVVNSAAIATTLIALGSPAYGQFSETLGIISMEAENFQINVTPTPPDVSFVNGLATNSAGFSQPSGASGGNTMFADWDQSTSPKFNSLAEAQAGGSYLEYDISVGTAGVAFEVYGRLANNNTNDSFWVEVLDSSGTTIAPTGGLRVSTAGGSTPAYMWDEGTATVTFPTVGSYKVRIYMRERGVFIDKLVFDSTGAGLPSGTGPGETGGSSNSTPPDTGQIWGVGGGTTLPPMTLGSVAPIPPSGYWHTVGTNSSVSMFAGGGSVVFSNTSTSDFRSMGIETSTIQLLNIGSSYKVSFDYKLDNHIAENSTNAAVLADADGAVRFGVWDSSNDNAGYLVQVDAGSADIANSTAYARIKKGTDASGGVLAPNDSPEEANKGHQLGKDDDNPEFVANSTLRTYTIELLRLSANEMIVTTTVDDGSGPVIFDETDVDDLFTQFDRFGIMTPTGSPDQGTSSGNGKGTLSNVQISFSPNAATLQAVNDTVNVNQARTVDSYPFTNDFGSQIDPNSFVFLTNPTSGTAVWSTSQSKLTYAHNGTETTSDSLSYQIMDAFGNTSSATVSYIVAPVGQEKKGVDLALSSNGICSPVPNTIGRNGVWRQYGGNTNAFMSVNNTNNYFEMANSGTDATSDDFRRVGVSLTDVAGNPLSLAAVGDYVEASFDITLRNYDSADDPNPDKRFRFGFVDLTDVSDPDTTADDVVAGYYARVDVDRENGVNSDADIRKESGTGTSVLGTGSTVGSSLSNTGSNPEDPIGRFLANGTTRNYTLRIERTTGNNVDITLTLVDNFTIGGQTLAPVSFTRQDTASIQTTFDNFAFMIPADGNGDNDGGVQGRIENFEVCFSSGAGPVADDYSTWAASFGAGGPQADANGNGVANLVEYALDVDGDGTADSCFAPGETITKSADATDALLTVESSTDLATWTTEATITTTSPYTVPTSGGPRVFYRLNSTTN